MRKDITNEMIKNRLQAIYHSMLSEAHFSLADSYTADCVNLDVCRAKGAAYKAAAGWVSALIKDIS